MRGIQQIYTALADYNPTLVAPDATFIPVGSALSMGGLSYYAQQNLFIDLQTHPQGSDLGSYYADTTNNPHVTVTPGIANFIQLLARAVRNGATVNTTTLASDKVGS